MGDMSNPNHTTWDLNVPETYAFGRSQGVADAEAGMASDSPLSGEWAGESIPEIFGCWPDDEILDAYEEGYAEGVADYESN